MRCCWSGGMNEGALQRMPDVTLPNTFNAKRCGRGHLASHSAVARSNATTARSGELKSMSMSMCPPTDDKPNSRQQLIRLVVKTPEHVLRSARSSIWHRQPWQAKGQTSLRQLANCDILLNAGANPLAENHNVALERVGPEPARSQQPMRQNPYCRFPGVITRSRDWT